MHSHIRQRALYFGQSSLNRPETTNVTVRRNSSSFISFFSKMRVPILLVFFPCLIFVKAQVPPPNVHLEKISTLYVPSRYNSHDYPEFKLGKHAAEQLAYDPAQKILYVTGKIYLFILLVYNFQKLIY